MNSGVEVADPGEKENILSPLEKPRDAQAGFALPLKEDLPASPIEKNFLSPIAPLQEHQASINALSPLESGCSGTEQKKQQVLIKIPKKLNKVISLFSCGFEEAMAIINNQYETILRRSILE